MAQNYATSMRAGQAPLSPVRQRGAWKLAYADFLTALCAFFLIMWLVHGVSGDQKAELAEQFGGATSAISDTAFTVDDHLQYDTLLARLDASKLTEAHPALVQLDEDAGTVRLELVDLELSPLFDRGEATLNEHGLAVMTLAAKAINPLDIELSIEGHTDSAPIRRAAYSNWELSSDRANAARRSLVASGLDPSRVRSVSGLADTRPLQGNAADLPQNRRLSIVLHLN